MKQTLPARTHATNLTDDELLLLDALFQMDGIATEQLHSDDYSVHMNTPYTHRLSVEGVRETLDSLRKHGLVHSEERDDDCRSWHLTEKGGLQWERERRPIWSHFVASGEWLAWGPDGEDDLFPSLEETSGLEPPVLVVLSPERELAQSYLETTVACRMYSPRSDVRIPSVRENFSEISYKTFPIMHRICVPTETSALESEEWQPIDFDTYERQRTWWTNVKELNTLHQAEKAKPT